MTQESLTNTVNVGSTPRTLDSYVAVSEKVSLQPLYGRGFHPRTNRFPPTIVQAAVA